jgi:hypothetical protein
VSVIHEQVVPRLHLSLRDARREILELHELAVELADALDREVDARHERRSLSAGQTAAALLKARRMGVL